MAGEFQATAEHLQNLGYCGAAGQALCSEIVSAVINGLKIDGYTLNQFVNDVMNVAPHRYLRGLQETVGGVNLMDVSLVMMCIIFAGLASGLTQGLLSLDIMEMEIKSRSGTDEEKAYAAKLIPIISRHHLLLVTLMLWNASATEALPIFLTALVPEYLAIIISVTLVLFVGEIIPASILTGPKQLQIAASLTPLVYFVLCVFFPLAYPISVCLDMFIGHEEGMTIYNRKEISTMMRLQREEGVRRASHSRTQSGVNNHTLQDHFQEEEVIIIDGALRYREMAVGDAMSPADSVYMIPVHERLSYKLIYEIFKSGYSRIPVYGRDKHDIVGLILAKDLIFVDPEDETPVKSFMDLFGRKPAEVWYDSKLGETLSMFRNKKSHMAVVRDIVEDETEGDSNIQVVGIITLEDIVEEILGTEIEDETDHTSGAGDTTWRDSVMMQPQRKLSSGVLRDPEMVRLKTMNNAMILEDSLTDEEVHSIGIYLFTNVPQVQRMFKENMSDLQKLVRNSPVISMTRKAALEDKPALEDFLYRKGKMTNTCTLILSGEVAIMDEEDGTNVRIKGPWSTIAPEALEAQEATHMINFSACVASKNLRYLRMSKFKASPGEMKNDDWATAGHELQKQQLRRMRSFGVRKPRVLSSERMQRTQSTNAATHRNGSEDRDFNPLELYGSKQRESYLSALDAVPRPSQSQGQLGVSPATRPSLSQVISDLRSSASSLRTPSTAPASGTSPVLGSTSMRGAAGIPLQSVGGVGSTKSNSESSSVRNPLVGTSSAKASTPIAIPGSTGGTASKKRAPTAPLLKGSNDDNSSESSSDLSPTS